MSVVKIRCPFTNCQRVMETEMEGSEDMEQFIDECPSCKRPLEITLAVLPGSRAVMANADPAPKDK